LFTDRPCVKGEVESGSEPKQKESEGRNPTLVHKRADRGDSCRKKKRKSARSTTNKGGEGSKGGGGGGGLGGKGNFWTKKRQPTWGKVLLRGEGGADSRGN